MSTKTIGRDLLLRALKNEVTERPPWVPFVGVHGGQLIGVNAKEFLTSADNLTRGLLEANRRYRPDGLPIAFDLQLEAEVLGCKLEWAEETPPAVSSHPLEEGVALNELPAFDTTQGRFPIVLEALDAVKAEIGNEVALYGLICGPFTLAMHLLGNSMFLSMFDNPDYIKAVIAFCGGIATKVIDAYIDHGADVIAVVDPMTSQISPEHFKEFVAPQLDQVFDHIRSRNALSSLFVCGDATRNLEQMANCASDNMSIDENIPLERVRDISRSTGKSFGGNLRLTTVLLFGDADDARLDAIRCIDTGGGCGFILAPGCDLPYAVPPENLEAVSEMVHDSYKREIAKRTLIAKEVRTGKHCDLPENFASEPDVHIDVVTLDSASCAPCQYMMAAVKKAAKEVSKPVTVKEHRISTLEGISAMGHLGVKNIPTICIDGEIAFSSIIPDQKSLIKRIEESIAKK